MKKKVAYLMHVDWNWIKQRPHFLAEGLSHYFDVDLFFIRNLSVKGLVKNNYCNSFKSINTIQKVPFSSKNLVLQKIEYIVNLRNILKICQSDYDYFWISSPIILQFININKLKGTIIYDCMDDFLAFPQNGRSVSYITLLEKKLLNKAEYVIVSSDNLLDKIKKRGFEGKINVINNGLNSNSLLSGFPFPKTIVSSNEYYNIMYFGTVSEWFDFNLVFKLLETFENIKFTIIGPSQIVLPSHERIEYIGPIRHEDLLKFALNSDAFIMPFIVNDLILSVDPVKVYEYIAFQKPVFVVQYNETEKFSDFVYLYNSYEDLVPIIKDVMTGGGKNMNEHIIKSFILKNSWDSRVLKILDVIRHEG